MQKINWTPFSEGHAPVNIVESMSNKFCRCGPPNYSHPTLSVSHILTDSLSDSLSVGYGYVTEETFLIFLESKCGVTF